jgi:hypothetical protein
MRPFSVFALALAVAGCSSSAKPPTATTGSQGAPGMGGSSNDDGGTSSSTCSFPSVPAAFTLPTIAGAPSLPFAELANTVACASGSNSLAYFLAEMTSDGLLDLVVTSACNDATVGTSVWLVYPNTGSGFASTPIRFALAPPTTPANCATASILDINGDFLPDYVVTSLCNDATVGSARWLVYLNAQTGFAHTPVSYTLPPGYSTGAFATTSVTTAECTGAKNVPVFSFFDITGDYVPDFVMTATCTDPSIGTTAWKVFPGSASGAAGSAISFALPTTPTVTSGAYATTSATLSCSAIVTRPTYYLYDFEITGKPGLVVTQQCNDTTTVGTTSWLWYRNTGAGFAATSTTIALPTIPGAPPSSFTSLAADGKCANGAGTPTYTLIDIDGNTVIDLVVTRDCGDSLIGVSYWQVFANTPGSGFVSPHRALSIPPLLGATPAAPLGLQAALDCTAPTHPAFTPAYLAGAPLDLVVTSECTDSTVGDSRWFLFPASCP